MRQTPRDQAETPAGATQADKHNDAEEVVEAEEEGPTHNPEPEPETKSTRDFFDSLKYTCMYVTI